MNSSKAFRNDSSYTKEYRNKCGMFPGGTLTVISSAENYTAIKLPSVVRKIWITTDEAVLRKMWNIGPVWKNVCTAS